MKIRYALLLLLTLWAVPASGQGGVNLAWNDCGESGTRLKLFACDTNAGVHQLYASFISPVPLTQLVGVEVRIDLAFPQPTVPSWWMAQSAGGCRYPAITSSANFITGVSACADPWQGAAVSGASISTGVPVSNQARITAVAAVPVESAVPVDDVTEYYALAVQISNLKTVGTGSCSGCIVPACVGLSSVRLVQPVGVGDYTLSWPLVNTVVGWQCAASFGHAGCTVSPPCVTSTRTPTWGAVKGMYR